MITNRPGADSSGIFCSVVSIRRSVCVCVTVMGKKKKSPGTGRALLSYPSQPAFPICYYRMLLCCAVPYRDSRVGVGVVVEW